MPNESILILSSNYGAGHDQAAKAILESVQQQDPGMDPILVDYMEWTHPYVNRVSHYLFMQSIKKVPTAYGYLYNATKDENLLSKLLKQGNRLGSSRLLRLLRSLNPAMVVSTFPLAAGAMSVLKQYGLTSTRTATVITDHSHHNHWIYPHTDRYLVGSEYVKQSLVNRHIQPEHIFVTGIPIRKEFSRTYEKPYLQLKHGLDPNLPTLLIMGGGYGMLGDIVSLLSSLEQLPITMQIVIICGHNHRVEKHLTVESRKSKHQIHLKGYIDHVSEMMGASDLLLTKPGGLSISEALAMGLPMILYNSIPGQEEDNAKFLIQSGVALQANHIQSLHETIKRVIQDPQLLRMMHEKTKILEKKDAAKDAVGVLNDLLQEESYLRSVKRLLPTW